MFSNHSFNALLKTLEEPPDHVKFILATTDPQKIPVTVLSRCLQFNLRRLLPEEIQGRLSHVLQEEHIEFENPALGLLSHAADGSMRDGLSLLDQALVYGGGKVMSEDVRAMLGTVNGEVVLDLLNALATGNGAELLAEISRIAAISTDFPGLLQQQLLMLSRLAMIQQLPDFLPADDPDYERLHQLSSQISPADVQLFYQILLQGQQDIFLAPDPRTGFEMVMLRALAFRPATPDVSQQSIKIPVEQKTHSASSSAKTNMPKETPDNNNAPAPAPSSQLPATPVQAETPVVMPSDIVPEAANNATEHQAPSAISLASQADWEALVLAMQLQGMSAQLANHCGFKTWNGKRLCLALSPDAEHLMIARTQKTLVTSLEQILGQPVHLDIKLEETDGETLVQRQARESADRQQEARAHLAQDELANRLKAEFDGEWIEKSIRPTTGN